MNIKAKKIGKTIRIHLSFILAHLYCLFNWKWNVYSIGNSAIVDTDVIYAGTKNSVGDIKCHIYTYPKWLTDKPRGIFF